MEFLLVSIYNYYIVYALLFCGHHMTSSCDVIYDVTVT